MKNRPLKILQILSLGLLFLHFGCVVSDQEGAGSSSVRVIDETSEEALNLSLEDQVEHAKGSVELETIDGLSINSQP